MVIVFDTTEIVSGSFWYGYSRAAIQRVYDGFDTMCITDDIMDEIRGVMMRSKFKRSDEVKRYAIAKVEAAATKFIVAPEHKAPADICRDSKDIKFLECAVAADADYIVSGDAHLLDLKEYQGIKIVNAKDYLDIASGL